MMKLIKLVYLQTNQILVTQIEEVTSELGEPDCKLIKPYVVTQSSSGEINLEPFMSGITKQTIFMISSDKIITLTEPTPTLVEKYEDLIQE